jgi:3-oxoacyl-[acyl-carrier-protein] synthase-1
LNHQHENTFISCLSLVCPVGLTPESAGAAMRAGIDAFTELPYMDTLGVPIIGGLVSDLPVELRGGARLIELLARALELAQPRLPRAVVAGDLPLFVCTRETERPGASVDGVQGELEARLGVRIRREGSSQVARGPVAAFEAIGEARRILSEGRAEACLIVAVDTLVDSRTLNWLDRAKRLKTTLQTDGVIPGEAACVSLISRREMMSSHVALRGLGFAVETATVLDDEPFLGKGMAAAARGALAEAGLAMHEVDFRISDVAGESYAFEELVLTQTRLTRKTRESQVLWHPADCVGDCGAAAGLIQLSWVEQAFGRGYAPGPLALAHASGAWGARAAAVLAR